MFTKKLMKELVTPSLDMNIYILCKSLSNLLFLSIKELDFKG